MNLKNLVKRFAEGVWDFTTPDQVLETPYYEMRDVLINHIMISLDKENNR